MKKAIAILLFFCLCMHIHAVEAIPVRIIVRDSITHETVPYASVFLRTLQDSTLQAGSTGKEGALVFQKLNSGDYKLHITAIGYQTLDTLISLDSEAKQPHTLFLGSSITELAGVTVTHVRKAYEQKYDRKVYTLTEAQKATSRTVLDLLRTLPGVIVNDEDKSVTYRGSAPVMQVNDMPAGFLYPDLSVIPAEKVRKIELIDASNRGSGVLGGIINILLVKPGKEGLDGVLSSEAKQAETTHGFSQDHALNLNWGIEKNVFFGNILYSDKDTRNLNHRTGYSLNSITGEENIMQSDTAKNKTVRLNGIIGYMRIIDSLRTDYFAVSMTTSSENSLGNAYVLRGNTDYFRSSASDTRGSIFGAGYGRVKNFTTPGKQITWNIYVNYPGVATLNRTNRYSYPNAPGITYTETLSAKSKGGSFYFYFNNPLKSGWNLSISETSNTGYESGPSDRWRNGTVDTLNLARDKYISWNDNLNVNMGRHVDKIRLEAGISFNHSYGLHDYNRYMVMERDTAFTTRRHFFSVCPSVNFNWHASETNDFSMKYAYSYKFPDVDNLTAYVDKRNIYNWTAGNPDLRAAGYHSFALGHVYSKDTYNFSTELIYKQSNNDIVTIGYYLPDNIRLTKPVNIGRVQELDAVFTNWIRLSSKLSMTGSATLNYKNLDQSNLKKEADAFGLDGEQFVFTQFNYNLNTYMTWSINKRNFASLRLNYYSKSLQYYGYRRPWLGSSLKLYLETAEKRPLQTDARHRQSYRRMDRPRIRKQQHGNLYDQHGRP
jgi:hypothetical protein